MYKTRESLLAILLLATLPVAPAHAGQKVTICHVPPGNPANVRTITVDVHAWPAHEAHGDTLGECASEPEDTGGPGSGSAFAGGFTITLCDGRHGELGRRIDVSETGRASVQEADCE